MQWGEVMWHFAPNEFLLLLFLCTLESKILWGQREGIFCKQQQMKYESYVSLVFQLSCKLESWEDPKCWMHVFLFMIVFNKT